VQTQISDDIILIPHF